ncbi:MAG: HNH endonuclease [Cyanobacteria bacterium]|nr:HNH endonuclease [Cyanobacteriota bacterium]
MKPDKTPRSKLPDAIRHYVFDRDNHQCQSCNTQKNLTIDHIIPINHGGSNDLSNLQTLCKRCNSSKRDRIDDRPSNLIKQNDRADR